MRADVGRARDVELLEVGVRLDGLQLRALGVGWRRFIRGSEEPALAPRRDGIPREAVVRGHRDAKALLHDAPYAVIGRALEDRRSRERGLERSQHLVEKLSSMTPLRSDL